MAGITTSDGRELLSASFLFEEWGVGSGSIAMEEELSSGEKITVMRGEDVLFSGIVTKVRYIHEANEYRAEIKDPVSAILSGEVEYSAGNAGDVIGGILSSIGSSLSGSVSLDIFGTGEDPVQWVDLIRSVSLASGKVFRYLPDGSYEFATPASSGIVDPLGVQTGINVDRYGNQVVATVDADWTEDVDPLEDPTVTVETGYGITRTITKIGEQVQSVVTDLGDGKGVSESWTWDSEGNLTRYDKAEASELERTTSYATYTVGVNDSLTIYEESVVERRANPLANWYFYRKYRKTTSSFLDEEAPIQIDEYVDWYFQEESQWHGKEWIRRFGLPKMPGILESSRNEYYEYSETDSLYHLQRTTSEGGLRKPDITKVLQVHKRSIHLSATVADEPSVASLGVIEKSVALTGIGIEDALTMEPDVTILEAAAQGYLAYCTRCLTASLTLPAGPFVQGNTVSWGGGEWTIDSIAFNLGAEDVTLECSAVPFLSDIEGAIGVDSEDIGTAVVHLLEKKAKRLNNVGRGQIVAKIDYETYSIHMQGDPVGKTRTARIDYQAGISLPPGKEVLLARPTGKGAGWEIITRRNDEPTISTYTPASSSIAENPPAVTGITPVPAEDNVMLYTVLSPAVSDPNKRVTKIAIDYGDEMVCLGELGSTSELPTTPAPNYGDMYMIAGKGWVYTFYGWMNAGFRFEEYVIRGTKNSASELPETGAKGDIWRIGADFWYWNTENVPGWLCSGESFPPFFHTYFYTLDPTVSEPPPMTFTPKAKLTWMHLGRTLETEWVSGTSVKVNGELPCDIPTVNSLNWATISAGITSITESTKRGYTIRSRIGGGSAYFREGRGLVLANNGNMYMLGGSGNEMGACRINPMAETVALKKMSYYVPRLSITDTVYNPASNCSFGIPGAAVTVPVIEHGYDDYMYELSLPGQYSSASFNKWSQGVFSAVSNQIICLPSQEPNFLMISGSLTPSTSLWGNVSTWPFTKILPVDTQPDDHDYFSAGAIAPNNCLYLFGSEFRKVVKLNLSTMVYTGIGPDLTTWDYGYTHSQYTYARGIIRQAILAPNGMIYGIGSQYHFNVEVGNEVYDIADPFILKVNPANDAVTKLSISEWGGKYGMVPWSAKVLPDGRIYIFGTYSSTGGIVRFDWDTETIEQIATRDQLGMDVFGTALSLDGKLIMANANGGFKVLKVDELMTSDHCPLLSKYVNYH